MDGERRPAFRPRRVLAGSVALLVLAWLAAGVRLVDPATTFALLEGPWPGLPRATSGRRVLLAPPGLLRVTPFPLAPSTVALPDAGRAGLSSADGSRYGLKGSITLRADPARPRELAAAAGGRGIEGVLLDAVREAAAALQDATPGERAVPTRIDAFRAGLGKALAARGATMVSLDLDGFDYLASTSDVAPVPSGARVLLVGWDGADWSIIDPLMAAGRMPNLARLVARGVRAKLLTITPTLSPVIWTSIATGVEPERHGVLDFLAAAGGDATEPVTSRARRVPALWEILSGAGVRVAVTGWWATWPADHVLGTMVTDRVAYQLFGYRSDPRESRGKAWPPELYERIRPRIVAPGDVPWEEVASYLDGPRRSYAEFDADERTLLDEFRTLLASGRTYAAAALAQRDPADRFEAVYFEGTDTVGHLFMPYRPPRLPGIDPARYASFHDVVDRYYETADRMLGALLAGREDWTVVLLSDHGFATDANRPRTTDSRIGRGGAADWHRRFGILVLSGPSVRRGATLEEASIYDVAPTVLALFGQPVPRTWPGHVLGPALDPAFLAAHPVTFRIADPVRAAAASVAEAPAGEAEAQELREKLESLGYVSADAKAPMTTANNRGVAFLAEGRFAEAAEEFRKAIAKDPAQATLWVNLGIALRFQGKTEEAKAQFVRALDQPGASRAAGHQLAQILMDEGDLDGAEKRLRAVLAREPDAADVRNALGLLLERKGDLDGARRAYEEAARSDPNAAEPRNNLGNLDKGAGRLAEAERRYEEAIAADPYFIGSYNNLALIYQDRGDLAKAIELYGRALARAPTNAIVMNNLASLYYAQGNAEAARTMWRKAATADPRYPSPLNNLAGVDLAEGNLDEAGQLLDRALALEPGYGDAHMNRSILMAKRGDGAGARRELERAAADPRSEIAARVELGRLALREGKPREAVAALEPARAKAGGRTDVLNTLGEAYARLGETERALEAWRTSLRIDPAQDRLKGIVANLEKR